MSKYRVEPIDPGAPGDGFGEWDAHPLRGGFAARLYPAVAPAHRDLSIQVTGPAGPVARVRATIGPDEVSFWGLPAVVACRSGAEPRHVKDGLAAALDHLSEAARAQGAARLVIGGPAGEICGPLGALMVNLGAEGTVQASAIIDLSRPVEALRADVRERFRSWLNWGDRNMRLSFIDAADPDRAAFERFTAFHSRIAGRGRRGDEYWDVYWNEILAGRAEVILGFLEDGALVAGSAVIRAGGLAYYASGVNERDMFDKPLGHWPMWNAILRAKQAGMDHFDLGEIPARSHADEKEIAIGFFKRGFTSNRTLRIRWTLGV
jgi:hypothetical protein